jgi:hypothetical protein
MQIRKKGDEIKKKSSSRDHPCQFWFNLVPGFRGEDLNVIFNQNMPNLHNRYKSAERKKSLKNTEYMFTTFSPFSVMFYLPCADHVLLLAHRELLSPLSVRRLSSVRLCS